LYIHVYAINNNFSFLTLEYDTKKSAQYILNICISFNPREKKDTEREREREKPLQIG